MEKTPTQNELNKIAQMARYCYGHILSKGRVIDIWRLGNGYTVINDPVYGQNIRAMARMYIELRGYWG